ncbi:MAG: metal ABC transporter permease [Alphaproteobacteria bacterium]
MNTILVLFSAITIGISCAIVGTYTMLYKKALVSDALAHATLPGIALGFFIAYYAGLNDGRFLPLLLAGGAFSGYLCSKSINWVKNHTRLHDDSAIASSLAFYFAFGLLLFSIIQNLESAGKSGLDNFLFGQIAGTTQLDALFLIMASACVLAICIFKHKDFFFFAFDKEFSALYSLRKDRTMNLLSILMVVAICLGLKTIGAILIMAMLIIPPAIGRLLSNNIQSILVISILSAIAGSLIGAITSLYVENLPTGPAIIISLSILFLLSFTVNILQKAFHVTRFHQH